MKRADNRGLALGYIAEYLESRLGFRKDIFLEWLSPEDGNGPSEKTLRRYIKGETPMKRWSFEEFWNMVEKAVQQYLEYNEMGKSTVSHAAETWEQEKETLEGVCRLFFLDLNAPERAADFPEGGQGLFETGERYKRQVLDSIKPVFEVLEAGIQYSLQENFPALAAVTAEDIAFWGDTLTMTEEEKAGLKTEMLQGATVDAGTMLACLQSEEVRCWVDFRNGDYRDTARNAKGTWERFREKFMALMPWQFPVTAWFLLTPFLVACAGVDPTAGKVKVQLPTKEDIDLLLLFKYCIAPEERERLLEKE